ncbi:uncharacterized protein LOC134240278 isoform X3 [Saccostrea cucullata]|uniref:uncharacterized protein LOC134240278 isoform X3 n=1 Tax=Saccostrea cuccullata TaxID=36930 RepID=UPI002ED4CFED
MDVFATVWIKWKDRGVPVYWRFSFIWSRKACTGAFRHKNEVDGFSLLHMEEKDVFAMLPTKVGPARKITVLLKEIQSAGKIKENQQKSSIEKETPPRPVPEIPLDEPGTSKTSNSNLETKNDCQGPQPVEMYVPAYSPLIVSLLASGEIMKEWDKFIEETAYHVLSVGNFESRGLYADFGRLMTTKYPCIGHKSLKEPWTFFNQKLSQKVRNIRWRWNARSKAPPVTDAKRMKRVQATVLDEDMNVDEAEKKLLQEFKKPVKMIDRALVAKAQRATFHVRRTFIERKHNGNCGDLIKKYPFLGIVEFIEKEFKLMKPDLQNYADRWLDVLQKLDELLGRSADEEDDRENDREIDVLNLLQNLEEKIKCQQKKGIKQPLITVCKKSDMTLKTKRDDPPRLLVVQDGQKNIMNCFIIGGGLEILCSTDLKKALTELLFCYYSWDLSYPKYFQILGFIQFYVLDDKENKFAKSFNYLKFTKEFDE